jgi:succinate-semialdehyde dehydrogenase/glutarate-semialdehyde dehydrogenase
MSITTTNPATGEVIQRYPSMEPAALDEALSQAAAAQRRWRDAGFAERGRCLRNAAALLRERDDKLARLMMVEMGKPLDQGRAEADKCARACEYYADNAQRLLARRNVEIDSGRACVDFQPLGVIFAVMPWNFPFWQVFRFAAPTLAAGNGAVLKHASVVTGCALAIEDLLKDAGFPEGLFRTLLIDHGQSENVIRDDRIRGVSLTGSVAAGRAVGRMAGEALKKCVLELGGSDAYVVLDDADIDNAAEQCVAGRLVNGGQSCVAAKRFVVVEAVRESFEAAVLQRLRQARLGDPAEPGVRVGPMARADLRDTLHRQVQSSVERGARCLLGGVKPDGPGAYYPVTFLVDVKPGMPAYEEELFGPVAVLIAAADEADAVRIANDSAFGLGGAVFSRDLARAERVAAALDCGMVGVNRQLVSDPRLPFGGVKQSGVGREIGEFGILEFVNIKTVTVA